MRPYELLIDPANVDAVGLASANDSTTTTFVIDGTLVTGGVFTSADGLAHRLILTDTAADNQTGSTYTINGTDADGHTQTEDIAGPNVSGTVETLKYFLTVTSVTIASPTATSATSLGTVDEIATKTIPTDPYREGAAAAGLGDVTGTISLDVQVTSGNPLTNTSGDQESLGWSDDGTLAAVTANLSATLSVWPILGVRVISNSYTDTAQANFHLTHSS